MIHIGKLYLRREAGQVQLRADIRLNDRGTTLWFGVEEAQGDYLCAERSDAFVVALLPTAMRGGHAIECETPMSERLHYQLMNYLMPTLCAAGDLYHPVTISAPLSTEPVSGKGGVATGFSGGVDSLYTIMTHGPDSEYPLTHLALFNVGVFEGPGYREEFQTSCRNARPFAEEMGLELIGLDSNISEVLPERYLDVVTFRLATGALALQNLLSVYLISASYSTGSFFIDLHSCESYELLTISSMQTESMATYYAGGAKKRVEKIRAISAWEPAHRWLHFCIYGHVGEKNCGRCKKCSRDMTTLYALGTLDNFEAVIDVPAYKRTRARHMGVVLSCRGSSLYDDVVELLESGDEPIPAAAYVYSEQFDRAMKNLREAQP